MKSIALVIALLSSLSAHAAVPTKIYAQQLVDDLLVKNPDVLVVMMHVTPPGAPTNIVIASNIGRLGKEADADDLRVIETGQPNLEISSGGDRFESELPLLDVSGNTVGAVGLVFPYGKDSQRTELAQRATQLRDELKTKISNPGNLMDPFPFAAGATTKTHAQKIVSSLMRRHPELLIAMMHVTPQGSQENIVVASSIGRIGKPADADDLAVIQSGEPNLGPDPSGQRFEAEIPLLSGDGKTLGALGLVFPLEAEKAPARYLAQAVVIQSELAKGISSVEELTALDP